MQVRTPPGEARSDCGSPLYFIDDHRIEQMQDELYGRCENNRRKTGECKVAIAITVFIVVFRNISVTFLACTEHKCYLCVVLNKALFDMVKFSELYRLLEANGWERREGSRHYKYVKSGYSYFIPVGRHASKEVPNGTLKSILKAADLDH